MSEQVVPNSLLTSCDGLIKALEAGGVKNIDPVNVKKVIKEVQDKIDEDESLTKAWNKIDLSIPYAYMWNAAAKKALKRRVYSAVPERELKYAHSTVLGKNKVVDKVHYFSALAKSEDKIAKAARMVTDHINKLADLGYVTGCLNPLGCLQLATEEFELEQYAVFCFVSLSESGTEYLKKNPVLTETREGELPKIMLTDEVTPDKV